jgi:carboxyvinyl-carboxyphosphonate phosphorylmutase
MTFLQRREKLRSILSGSTCIRPGSVYDAISIRIAEDLGFELGMFGGSVASLAVLGDPDVALITLTELAEQMRRMSRASALPVLVDADHGYGNALNVRRTIEELETAGAAGLTIEDTLLPQAYGETATQLISLEEGVGKMKAALDARRDSSLVIVGRNWKRYPARRGYPSSLAARRKRCPILVISGSKGSGLRFRATRQSRPRLRLSTRPLKRYARDYRQGT